MSLGAISNRIHYGYNESAKERGNAKLLRITDIQNGSVNWTSVPYCSLEDREIAKFRLAPGDIVIARTGGTIGKSFLIAEKLEELAVFASYLIRVIPDKLNVNPSYLLRFLDSPYYWEQLSDNSRGTGQPNVNAKALAGIKVPLPPIEEQLRIVAKISQLFDQIELAEKAYNELSEPLAERFRQLCLEKAIQGKLVPQLGTNSPRIAFSRIFCRKISKFIFELLAKVSKSRIQHLQLLLHPIQKLIHVEHFDFGFFFLQPAR